MAKRVKLIMPNGKDEIEVWDSEIEYFDQMGSSTGMGRLDTAYDNYLKSLEGGSTPPTNQEPFQPVTMQP